MASILIKIIRFYQVVISPYVGDRCRYYPSCSNYAMDAIRDRGAFVGTYWALRRLLRCHPWGGSGVDPYPIKSRSIQ